MSLARDLAAPAAQQAARRVRHLDPGDREAMT
jgi:hypothetical protein